jgi:hypothetical protein
MKAVEPMSESSAFEFDRLLDRFDVQNTPPRTLREPGKKYFTVHSYPLKINKVLVFYDDMGFLLTNYGVWAVWRMRPGAFMAEHAS